MYKYILFKPLGIRLRVVRSKRDRRVDIRTLSVVFQYVLGEIYVESVLDRCYLEGE